MNKLIALFLFALFFQSCSTGDKAINNHSFQKRKYTKGWHISINKNPKLHHKINIKNKPNPIDTNYFIEGFSSKSLDSSSKLKPIKLKQKNQIKEIVKINKPGKKNIIDSIPFNNKINSEFLPIQKSEKIKKKNALLIGLSLISMALLAFFSIPVVAGAGSLIGLIGIFILDILVIIGIERFYYDKKPKLRKGVTIFRSIYTLFLGIGIAHFAFGNTTMFTKLWGIGLISFGFHLILLGILFENKGTKKWINYVIKSLLIIAGIGYLIQYIGIWLVINPVAFASLVESIFIIPMILGEISLAIWMLFRAAS